MERDFIGWRRMYWKPKHLHLHSDKAIDKTRPFSVNQLALTRAELKFCKDRLDKVYNHLLHIRWGCYYNITDAQQGSKMFPSSLGHPVLLLRDIYIVVIYLLIFFLFLWLQQIKDELSEVVSEIQNTDSADDR